MFGSVLATLKTSACSDAAERVATSSAARTKPLSRETMVPAAITALFESRRDCSSTSSTGGSVGWSVTW